MRLQQCGILKFFIPAQGSPPQQCLQQSPDNDKDIAGQTLEAGTMFSGAEEQLKVSVNNYTQCALCPCLAFCLSKVSSLGFQPRT